jgi:phage terminase small subunit
MPGTAQGVPEISDPSFESLGPAMLALNPAQRRFVCAALIFPTGKDWQIAKAAGYASASHGALRHTAWRLMHDEKIIEAMHEEADKRLRGSALLGVSVITKIARTDGHRDQLKAAEALLNRLGMHEMTEHKVSVEHKQPAQILELAARLAKDLGVGTDRLIGNNRTRPIEGEFVEVPGGQATDA